MRSLYLGSVLLQMVAAALWVGGMLFLVFVLVPMLRRPALRSHAILLLEETGLRFRSVGWAALLTLVATGLVQMSYRAGNLAVWGDTDAWRTPFGRFLAVKVGLVAVILVLSGLHDFVIGPRATRLLRSDPGTPQSHRARMLASWMGRINLLLGLIVMALAVILVRGTG